MSTRYCYSDDSEQLFQAKRKAGQKQGAAMRQIMHLCGQETVQIEIEGQP